MKDQQTCGVVILVPREEWRSDRRKRRPCGLPIEGYGPSQWRHARKRILLPGEAELTTDREYDGWGHEAKP